MKRVRVALDSARRRLEALAQVTNLPPEIQHEYERTVAEFQSFLRQFAGQKRMARNLTPRELEVFELIASGKSTKEAAYLLRISFRTAVCHRYHICRKLGVHNAADLARAAIRMGLIEP